jgi:hypothetical protein
MMKVSIRNQPMVQAGRKLEGLSPIGGLRCSRITEVEQDPEEHFCYEDHDSKRYDDRREAEKVDAPHRQIWSGKRPIWSRKLVIAVMNWLPAFEVSSDLS